MRWRSLAAALAIAIGLSGILYFRNVAHATADERAVLAVAGRSTLDQNGWGTCLAPWTEPAPVSAGTYGFSGGGTFRDRIPLDRALARARGRAVSLLAGSPASRRPVWVSLLSDQWIGCDDPLTLSTPMFAGAYAFVSARGRAQFDVFALRRIGREWRVVGGTTIHPERPVI